MISKRQTVAGSIVASLAVAAVLNVGPVGSLNSVARADASPVSVQFIRIADRKSDEGQNHAIYMTFRNESEVTANEVRFRVRQGQDFVDIADVGTFSSGTNIAHRFYNPKSGFESSWLSPNATLTYVHFADGTTWTSGTKPHAQERMGPN